MKIGKDEFKEAMRRAKIEEEVNEAFTEPAVEMPEMSKNRNKTAINVEKRQKTSNIDTKPKETETKERKKPGPKPGTRKQKETAPVAAVPASTASAPVSTALMAAGREKRTLTSEDEAKAVEVMNKAIAKATSKAQRQKEALQAAVHIMTDYTDSLRTKADKFANMADIYAGYVSTLEEMTE